MFSLDLNVTVTVACTDCLPRGSGLMSDTMAMTFSGSTFRMFGSVKVFSVLKFVTFADKVPFSGLMARKAKLTFMMFPRMFGAVKAVNTVLKPMFFVYVLFTKVASTVTLLRMTACTVSRGFSVRHGGTIACVYVMKFLVSAVFTAKLKDAVLKTFSTFLGGFTLLLKVLVRYVVFN